MGSKCGLVRHRRLERVKYDNMNLGSKRGAEMSVGAPILVSRRQSAFSQHVGLVGDMHS